jgi:carbon monoxide dehydrogenase subunit G
MKFSASVEINASPEKAWPLINNIEEWPKWIPSLKKIEKVSEGSLGVGSRVLVVARSLITVNLLMTITEFVPGRSVVMEGKVLGVRMKRYYEMEPVNGRARLTAGGEVSGLLACLVRRGGQRLSEEIVQALKKKVEEAV